MITVEPPGFHQKLILLRFGEQARICLSGVIVRFAPLLFFIAFEESLFLRPAVIHAFEAPFDALA